VSDDTNTTLPDDTNTTDSDDANTTDGDDDVNYDDLEPNEDQINSDYDTRGAVLDPNACRTTDVYVNSLRDSGFDPDRATDDENGMEIGSGFLNETFELSQVALFYPDLFVGIFDRTSTIRGDGYTLTYDQNWVNSEEKTVYVRTPRVETTAGYFGCYKYVLDSADSSEIEQVKVYRLR
jgi:hypothetical protein